MDVFVNNVANYFRFPGQIFDIESGLHYNWNRYYNPETGRYISPDSIGLDGGLNLFAYVGGDQVNKFDTMGLDTWSGASDTAGEFFIFYGQSDTLGWVTNWETREKCYIEIKCEKYGAGAALVVTASGIFIINGPKCGKDLAGISIGASVEGGIGGYASLA